MSRRIIVAVIAVAVAIAFWVVAGTHGGARSHHDAPEVAVATTPAAAGLSSAPTVVQRAASRPGSVQIAGTVIDRADGTPVPGVEVVVKSALGEASVAAAADGTFAMDVSPGAYRLFVRGDDVMTVGIADPPRIDAGPRVDVAGMPDDTLMPLVVADRSVTVELPVVKAGTITGSVVDEAGHLVPHAVVRARSGFSRPALGTDIAETDEHGVFTLHVPTGGYVLDAAHAAYAGTTDQIQVAVAVGKPASTTLHLVRGCVIEGKVVSDDGSPANDGALEIRNSRGQFGPGGVVDADGTFRFTRTEPGEVTLRAWPWKSMPTAAKTFACTNGMHVANVVFKIPGGTPSLTGAVVDASGAPVPFAYLDLTPLDDQGPGLQERADAAGKFTVFDAAPGRYKLVATAAGAGITSDVVIAPKADLRVQLAGTGRIEGTATDLANGSFEVAFESCKLGNDLEVPVAHEPRLVVVHGGRFTIDNVPACPLTLALSWRGVSEHKKVNVDLDKPAALELDVGTPKSKVVMGTVRDDAGRPLAGANITSRLATVQSDKTGRYAIETTSGAELVASNGDATATASASHANVTNELVDLVVR
ncbi:MAG: carboxypeptidase regulatory-like domain-containing protein [Deltaproteobacteria bacterium]|nr:carboxypeptidase regulatory-like domain-containing protein [Deltaproteobacteria bacterium]